MIYQVCRFKKMSISGCSEKSLKDPSIGRAVAFDIKRTLHRCRTDLSFTHNLPCQAPTKIHTCRTSAQSRCRSRQSLLSPLGSQSNPRNRWRAQRFWGRVLLLQARCSTAQTWWKNQMLTIYWVIVYTTRYFSNFLRVCALTSFHTAGWTPCSWRSWAWSDDPPSAHTGSIWI